MPKKVFISYKHEPKEWVKRRLVPCLEAGGVEEVIVDYKFGQAGQSLIGQMDKHQDRADLSVLVFSPDYLTSAYCTHEMQRALAKDPQFQTGKVIPVIREHCNLPPSFITSPPLWVDLTNDKVPDQWDLLLKACQADLGCSAPGWLKARDDLVRYLRRHDSVNLVIRNNPKWRELLKQTQTELETDHGIRLGVVDLAAGTATIVEGLISLMIRACGGTILQLNEANALLKLDEYFSELPTKCFLALIHFDMISRETYYNDRVIAALHNLVMDKQKLVLLIESRDYFINLVPQNHPVSKLDLKVIELGGRP